MTDGRDDARARNRWIAMTLARLAAVALVVIGLLILDGAISGPPALGYVLLAAGLAGALVVPQMLARKWRTPRP